jgi:hypothetical protein
MHASDLERGSYMKFLLTGSVIGFVVGGIVGGAMFGPVGSLVGSIGGIPLGAAILWTLKFNSGVPKTY